MMISSKIQMQKKEEPQSTKKIKFMSRNVTEFKHLMQNSYITQKDLDWVINLRGHNHTVSQKTQSSGPPEVYYKKTKAFEIKTSKDDKHNQQPIIANEYDQIYLKNTEKSHHTKDQVQFYSSLRSSKCYGRMSNSKSQKSFDTIPYKDRNQRPRFIKKQYIKHTKPLTKEYMDDGLDGAHKQEPYSQNILKNKNYGLLESFTKVKGRNQISLPSLAWQMALRNYR